MSGLSQSEASERKDASMAEHEVIGAIRLAMEAGSDGKARLRVIRELLKMAPPTDPRSTESVRLLIEAVRVSKCEFRVTDHEPRGRLVKV